MEATVAYTHATTPTFMATVGPDHVIRLPDSVPLGAKVAIIIVNDIAPDPVDVSREMKRKAKFEATLATIREAIANGYDGSNLPGDEEIARLVAEARKSRAT